MNKIIKFDLAVHGRETLPWINRTLSRKRHGSGSKIFLPLIHDTKFWLFGGRAPKGRPHPNQMVGPQG